MGSYFVKSRSSLEPSDHGLIGWSMDPAAAVNTQIVTTAGLVHVAKIFLREPALVTNILFFITTAGATLTANQCLAGLYQNGTLIGSTGNQATAWAGTGLITMALTGGPFAVAAGNVYAAWYYNGTTAPTLSRGAGTTGLVNAGFAAASSRFGTADTGRTTSLPATLGTVAANNVAWWVALS